MEFVDSRAALRGLGFTPVALAALHEPDPWCGYSPCAPFYLAGVRVNLKGWVSWSILPFGRVCLCDFFFSFFFA